MLDLAAIAAEAARVRGASYADARIIRLRFQQIRARQRSIVSIRDMESFGAGVRAFAGGAWGFAASSNVGRDDLGSLAARAVDLARSAGAARQTRPLLAAVKSYQDVWQTPINKDPFRVPIEPKIDLLLSVCAEALELGVTSCEASMSFAWEERFFASTEGSLIEQVLVRSHPTFLLTRVGGDGRTTTRRSLARPVGAGFEYVGSYPWLQEVRRAAEDLARKAEAASVLPGVRTLILHPSNLWLVLRETLGRATGGDRVAGTRESDGGGGFVRADDPGRLRCASEIVNVVADRTQPAGLATVGYDDDGVPAGRWEIVRDGVLTGFQTTRETAGALGAPESRGCARAGSWDAIPVQTMPNVSLLPGTRPLGVEDVIAATEDGVYVEGDGFLSVDPRSFSFRSGGQTFHEVKGGRIVRPLGEMVFESNAFDFWRSCDLLGGGNTWELGGVFAGGEGGRDRAAPSSHGCPVARFRSIRVLPVV
jgi:TldD protein